MKNAPDNPLAHYQLGLAYNQKSNTQQAESGWREAVRLRPTMTEAWAALGKNAILRSDWRTVEDISNQLKKYSPNSVDAYLYHATARMNQGDAAGAETDLKYLLVRTPNSPMPYLKLGQLRVAQKRWNDAEALFKQALDRDPNSIEAITGLAGVDLAKNKPDDATKLVQAQIDRNPDSSPLFLVQGQIFLRTKKMDLAVTAFSRSLELDPKNLSALVLLAQTRVALGKTDEAIEGYKRAIELAPQNVRLYVTLGSPLRENRQLAIGSRHLSKRPCIQPDDPLASNDLAYILLEHGGDVNVALTLAQTARKGLPNLPNAADTLGWATITRVPTPLLLRSSRKQ